MRQLRLFQDSHLIPNIPTIPKITRHEVIEAQLAHGERNKVRGAYNHAEYLPERRAMMQEWADWLDRVRTGE